MTIRGHCRNVHVHKHAWVCMGIAIKTLTTRARTRYSNNLHRQTGWLNILHLLLWVLIGSFSLLEQRLDIQSNEVVGFLPQEPLAPSVVVLPGCQNFDGFLYFSKTAGYIIVETQSNICPLGAQLVPSSAFGVSPPHVSLVNEHAFVSPVKTTGTPRQVQQAHPRSDGENLLEGQNISNAAGAIFQPIRYKFALLFFPVILNVNFSRQRTG